MARSPVVFDRLPLVGGVISGPFKSIYDLGTGKYEHGGADLLVANGPTYRARIVNPDARPGKCKIHSKNQSGTDYGIHCVLNHLETDEWSLLAHMDELVANVGDILDPGDFIGYAGFTGLVSPPNVNGAHVHWEVCSNPAAPTFGAIRSAPDAQGVRRLTSPTLRDPASFLRLVQGEFPKPAPAATLEDALASLAKTSDKVNEILVSIQRLYDDGQITRDSLNALNRVVIGMTKPLDVNAVADVVVEKIAKLLRP